MEAKELRIGNWVEGSFGNYLQMTADDFMRIHVNGEDNPIPLTEEILLKAGFSKKVDLIWSIYTKDWIGLYKMDGTPYYEVDDTYTKIKSVHQLQNLYFALTGEELEIEL